MAEEKTDFTLLRRLLAIDGPSGDEGAMAEWLTAYIAEQWPDTRQERLGDSVIVLRGERPSVAVFAHTDTTGFTLGYDKRLIPIGDPSPGLDEPLRPAHSINSGNRLKPGKHGGKMGGPTTEPPGTGWVYAAEPEWQDEQIISPYLDNRAGIWAALQALERCPRIAVAFTVGEEHSGQGAFVCARRLYDGYGITQALISDITWDTAHVHCGQGVAISLRDKSVPRRRFLNQVMALAERSGLSWQREIESDGGSDGASIEKSGVPMDWVFVGAPEKKPHTSAESLALSDLSGMVDMLTFLVNGLTGEPT